MSRHLAELSGVDVLVHFAQDVVELARSDIALHLLIPLVVFPAMEPGRKFGPLFKRKLFDGGLDLVNAHEFNDMQLCPSWQRSTISGSYLRFLFSPLEAGFGEVDVALDSAQDVVVDGLFVA